MMISRLWFRFVYDLPRWILFRRTCLRYCSRYDSYCCLSKGHEGPCHGDVSFDRKWKLAELDYQDAKRRAGL